MSDLDVRKAKGVSSEDEDGADGGVSSSDERYTWNMGWGRYPDQHRAYEDPDVAGPSQSSQPSQFEDLPQYEQDDWLSPEQGGLRERLNTSLVIVHSLRDSEPDNEALYESYSLIGSALSEASRDIDTYKRQLKTYATQATRIQLKVKQMFLDLDTEWRLLPCAAEDEGSVDMGIYGAQRPSDMNEQSNARAGPA